MTCRCIETVKIKPSNTLSPALLGWNEEHSGRFTDSTIQSSTTLIAISNIAPDVPHLKKEFARNDIRLQGIEFNGITRKHLLESENEAVEHEDIDLDELLKDNHMKIPFGQNEDNCSSCDKIIKLISLTQDGGKQRFHVTFHGSTLRHAMEANICSVKYMLFHNRSLHFNYDALYLPPYVNRLENSVESMLPNCKDEHDNIGVLTPVNNTGKWTFNPIVRFPMEDQVFLDRFSIPTSPKVVHQATQFPCMKTDMEKNCRLMKCLSSEHPRLSTEGGSVELTVSKVNIEDVSVNTATEHEGEDVFLERFFLVNSGSDMKASKQPSRIAIPSVDQSVYESSEEPFHTTSTPRKNNGSFCQEVVEHRNQIFDRLCNSETSLQQHGSGTLQEKSEMELEQRAPGFSNVASAMSIPEYLSLLKQVSKTSAQVITQSISSLQGQYSSQVIPDMGKARTVDQVDLLLEESFTDFGKDNSARISLSSYQPECYVTSRYNPLARSCPLFSNPISHSPYTLTSGARNSSLSPVSGQTCDSLEPTCNVTLHMPTASPEMLSSNELFSSAAFMRPYTSHSIPPMHQHSYHHMYCCKVHEQLGPVEVWPNEKPNKILWLSEEEAEIIQLIRLYHAKEAAYGYDSSYVAKEGTATTAKEPSENQSDVQLNGGKGVQSLSHGSSSMLSSCSTEELASNVVGDKLQAPAIYCQREIDGFVGNIRGRDHLSTNSTEEGCFNDEKQKREVLAGYMLNAVVRIQQFWRKYMKKKTKDEENRLRLEALKYISEVPVWMEHIMQTAITAMKHGQVVGWFQLLQKSAYIIQHAWIKLVKRRSEKFVSQNLPGNLKGYYNLIAWRHARKGLIPPTYESFVKLLERVQAATEGARIRYRLKSRRLQIIIKEIKEIKVLLQQFSQETFGESSLSLLPQFSMQLQQKQLQLQTALSGPVDAARVLLKRCPSTPLIISTSKASAAVDMGLSTSVFNDLGNSRQQPKTSSGMTASVQSTRTPLLRPRPVVASEGGIVDNGEPLRIGEPKTSTLKNCHAVQGREIQWTVCRREKILADHQGTKTIRVLKAMESKCFLKSARETTFKSNSLERENGTGQSLNLQQTNSDFLFGRSSDKVSARNGSMSMEVSETDIFQQQQAITKRPFLRRKSVAMAPQRLDWSKVKPMVSSRLEPELKTRISSTRSKNTPVKKKMNYNQIRSRIQSWGNSTGGNRNEGGSMNIRQSLEKRSINKAEKVRFHVSGKLGNRMEAAEFRLKKSSSLDSREISESTCIFNKQSAKRHSLRYMQSNSKDTQKDEEILPNLELVQTHLSQSRKADDKVSSMLSPPPVNSELAVLGLISRTGENEKKHYDSGRYGALKDTSKDVLLKMDTSLPECSQQKASSFAAQENTPSASMKLEKMFEEIVFQKDGRKPSLNTYFGATEESIIPQLHPSSTIFQASTGKVRMIHEALNKDGRDTRTQRNRLCFVHLRK